MRPTLPLLLALALCPSAAAADPAPAELEALLRQAAALRPTAQEARWQTIPWQTSAVAGERLAQQERRPILYWNVDDDPLDRC